MTRPMASTKPNATLSIDSKQKPATPKANSTSRRLDIVDEIDLMIEARLQCG